jgi:hypothetical protein
MFNLLIGSGGVPWGVGAGPAVSSGVTTPVAVISAVAVIATVVSTGVMAAVEVIEVLGEGLVSWVDWASAVAVADWAMLCGEQPATKIRAKVSISATSARVAAVPRSPTCLRPRSIVLSIKLLYFSPLKKRVYHTIVSCRAAWEQALCRVASLAWYYHYPLSNPAWGFNTAHE